MIQSSLRVQIISKRISETRKYIFDKRERLHWIGEFNAVRKSLTIKITGTQIFIK